MQSDPEHEPPTPDPRNARSRPGVLEDMPPRQAHDTLTPPSTSRAGHPGGASRAGSEDILSTGDWREHTREVADAIAAEVVYLHDVAIALGHGDDATLHAVTSELIEHWLTHLATATGRADVRAVFARIEAERERNEAIEVAERAIDALRKAKT